MKKLLLHSIIFCVTYFFFTGTHSFAQPVADFNVSVASGCNSLQALFTDLSTGNPTSWVWNFGDGQTSNTQNPLVTYTKPGIYSVSLTVQNLVGKDSITKTNYIVVDSFLTARYIRTQSTGCAPSSVAFIDQSSPGSGGITSWHWNFGDGTTSDSTNPTHVYTDTGTFNVTLIITNAAGCRDTISGDTVKTGLKPTVFFTTPVFDICASSPVQLQNRTKGTVTSWLWYFGDEDTSTKKSPLHYFTDTGFMNVKLIATNNGCSDSFQTHDLHIKPPVAKIRDIISSCDNPYLIGFQAKYRLEKGDNWYWDFGDGTTLRDKYPNHTYSQKGSYKVKLFASGSECNYSDSIIVQVIDEHPSFTYNSNHIDVCRYDTARFIATNYDTALIDTFKWDYGDGDTTGLSLFNTSSHVYKNTGTFSASLITKNILGCYDTITSPVNIYGPKAAFTNNGAACINNAINFTDQSTSDSIHPITKWTWDYGDGTIAVFTGPPFTHIYKTSDTFSIKLKIEDSNGCADTLTKPNVLVTIPIPVAAFTIGDTLNCLHDSVSFFDNSAGQLLGRTWYFGDGDTSTQIAPKHVYLTTGTYSPTLIVGNQAGCSDTLSKSVHILPLPGVDAGGDSAICLGQSIVLHAGGASSYTWLTDASLNCTACANPVANPKLSTRYYVTGTDTYGCRASDSVFVEVEQPITLSVNGMDTLCYGSSIQLSASGAKVYNWQPSTGLSNTTIPNPVATPLTTTTYTVKGTDAKSCFTDTAFVTVVVAQNPQFNIVDTNVTLGANNTYLIKTTGSPDIIKWQWSPPVNLSCTNCPEPIASGNKIIQYTAVASNAYGCSDSDKIIIKGACSSDLIFIPNTFSPNGDGVNDRFYPRGPGIYLIKSMRIFNRLGQTIFEKINFQGDIESEGWDGTMNGKKLPEDVYIYLIEVICNNGTIITFKGNITLLL